MIKTTITPKNNNCLIQIPNNYIGKELEIFIYAKDELAIDAIDKKLSSKYKGILTNDEADSFQTHIAKSRTNGREIFNRQ